jgi:DNA gyrase inhibitor GyrI
MPISPPDKIRYDLCEIVMQKIDSDVEVTIHEEGSCENYRVVVRDELTQEERDFICKEYLEADWKEVTSKTSAENGERPGLLMFTLIP